MRRWTIALVCVLPVLSSGCSFAQNIQRNLLTVPHYSFAGAASHHRNLQMAREAYLQMASRYSDHEFSCDYRRGFVDGFADYLDYGGVGEPPPIPPASYRYFGYMTPSGLAGMEDWTTGFRHGAATAKASGLRELIVLPVYWGPNYNSATPNAASNPPPTNGIEHKLEPLPPPTKETPKPVEVTPAPKAIEGPPPAPGPIVPPTGTPPATPAPPGELNPVAYRKPAPTKAQTNNPGDKPSVPPPSAKSTTEPMSKPAMKKSAPKQPTNPGDKPSVPPPSARELPPESY